jgi:GAF domain-containing protein
LPEEEHVVTPDDPVRDSLLALSRFFVGDSTLGDTLQRVIDLAVQAVPPAASAGLTMLVDDEVRTSVCSAPEVTTIDQAQYAAGTGPCLDAFREGVVNTVPSTARDDRWPSFSRTALEHGIRSTLSLPLVVGDERLAALNFYSRQEDGFSDEYRRNGETFAIQAAVVLANAQAYWDARILSERINEAMRSRAAIEQAKGILMAQSHISPDAAFDLMRRASEREHRKLRDIARELIDRHTHGEAPP